MLTYIHTYIHTYFLLNRIMGLFCLFVHEIVVYFRSNHDKIKGHLALVLPVYSGLVQES